MQARAGAMASRARNQGFNCFGLSRRAAAGRAELLAKRGCIGRMQRPAELVPIPEYLLGTSLVPPWYLRKVRKNPEKISLKFSKKFGKLLENLQKPLQKLVKNCKICRKN